MSWRPTNHDRRGSSSSRSGRTEPSLLNPTLLILIGAALVLGLVGVGLIVVFGGGMGQQATTAMPPQPVAATLPPASTATTVPTATPAPTVAARSRATQATAAPVSAAEAGPVETTGDAAAGAVLFAALPSEAIAVGGINCNICHNIAPGSSTLVGPSLSGIGATAASRQPHLSAAQYLRVSIINPNAYLVDGFAAGTMPAVYQQQQGLTPAQIEDLVAYMLTLP
ncbi:cytochrome c [Candidatus Chloroploca sp. M-50]|uniref:Cytochrome c n=1 Tax=Candidatus Chloroploca mongolica TaxID=2528176 RepID=A0ABS4DHI7_9CHLR|nr:cytochrome c [Candidatus Chloroploca mongolica]MBP1468888.1 cytochrome c [Candidatus Chloroploca mongolica]